jgi:glycosyltransferase involved in cell wall biosynthesis
MTETGSLPLISIITPVMNAEGTLAEAVESVLAQRASFQQGKVEHLLIDAISSDRTLEIAARYPHLKVISESDLGIYDGMNKGANLSSGAWLLFLQADDWLPAGTLGAYREALKNFPEAVMISGGAEAVKKSGEKWLPVWSVNDFERKKPTVANIALGEPMINARLIRKDYFNRIGGFSLDFSLASDRDFLLRVADSQGTKVEIPQLTYRYRWHSGSSTMTEGNKLTQRLSAENLAIAQKHLSEHSASGKRILKKWHSQLTIQLAMNALESFKMKGVLGAMRDGIAINPFWPYFFILEILHSLPGLLARGGRTRSQVLSEMAPK